MSKTARIPYRKKDKNERTCSHVSTCRLFVLADKNSCPADLSVRLNRLKKVGRFTANMSIGGCEYALPRRVLNDIVGLICRPTNRPA